MKNIRILIFAMLISLSSILPIFAVSDSSYLVIDDADMISDSEEENLLERAKSLSDKYEMDIAMITIPSLGGVEALTFAETVYEEYDYGYGPNKDGMIFLISPEERDYAFYRNGKPYHILTEYWEAEILEAIISYLKEDRYEDAFEAYLNMTEVVFSQLNEDGTLPKPPTNPLFYVGAVVISFLIALIAAEVGRSTLKSVEFNRTANSYAKEGSMRIRSRSDNFLYRNVTSRPKPKKEERSSSGGGSSGGSSGKY